MAAWNIAASNRSARFILGKTVTVDITSTFRKRLPHRGCCYVKYGSVREDGQDKNLICKNAFAIVTDGALTEFTGEVIAIVKTPEHNDFFIVAPRGALYYEPEIKFLVEGYIDSQEQSYICFNEKSCGAVLFTHKDGKRYYILIKNMSGHVGFPKGHVEFGEDEHSTALREIYEETGVRASLIPGYRETYNYLINGYVRKEAVYFTAPFDASDVRMNIMEISEYKLVTYDEAMKILNYPHDRNILKKANDFVDQYLDSTGRA